MIRQIISSEDKKKAADLASLCFHDQINEVENFFSNTHDLEMIGYFSDTTLLATAGSHNFKMYIRDSLMDCSGIAAVMTHPAERRKGYVKELMHKILTDKRNQGIPVSALWPFDHGFYHKFGYANAEKSISYMFKPGEIKSNFKLENNIKVTDVTEKKDYTPLKQIAKNAANKYTRIIGEVDAWLLRGKITGKFKTYLLERDGIPIAYISFKFVKKGEWNHHLNIMDFAYIDIQAKHSLLGFLRNFQADISKIAVSFPIQEEFESYLDGVKDTHKFNQWPSMVRILDVKKCFEQIDYHEAITVDLYFKLADEILPDNSGTWKLSIQDGKCEAVKLVDEINEEKILDLTINQLSQILIGYSTIGNLFESSSKQIPDEWKLKDLFPEMPCSFMLWF